MRVETFIDADWVGFVDDGRSTLGDNTLLRVIWLFGSTKQPIVARSSAKAEFRIMAHRICKMLWIRNLLKELGFNSQGSM